MEKIEFKNLPDKTTPINTNNLNLLQDNVEEAINNVEKTINDINTYSTEETFTGKYWVDGKKIYKKCFDRKNPSKGEIILGNVDKIIEHNLWAESIYDNTYPVPYNSPDEAGYDTAVNLLINTVRIDLGNYYITTDNFWGFIEYTKITD